MHIQNEHTSMFDYLLNMDKKFTGLTDLQKKMVQFFYMGLNDKEIVKELDGGSTSTIRNHRFTLREKMKQAKVFLALMELSEENQKYKPNLYQFIEQQRWWMIDTILRKKKMMKY